jgi:hypothetical protein
MAKFQSFLYDLASPPTTRLCYIYHMIAITTRPTSVVFIRSLPVSVDTTRVFLQMFDRGSPPLEHRRGQPRLVVHVGAAVVVRGRGEDAGVGPGKAGGKAGGGPAEGPRGRAPAAPSAAAVARGRGRVGGPGRGGGLGGRGLFFDGVAWTEEWCI